MGGNEKDDDPDLELNIANDIFEDIKNRNRNPTN
jgi:hypothetical protein